jgi:hypothetical protein
MQKGVVVDLFDAFSALLKDAPRWPDIKYMPMDKYLLMDARQNSSSAACEGADRVTRRSDVRFRG